LISEKKVGHFVGISHRLEMRHFNSL